MNSSNIMNELGILDKASRENQWLETNFESIQEKFESKFVAVENEGIVESSSDLQDLMNKLTMKGKNPAFLIVRYIHKKGISVIL
jgi:signal transduction protein with GAF and PtsI domain